MMTRLKNSVYKTISIVSLSSIIITFPNEGHSYVRDLPDKIKVTLHEYKNKNPEQFKDVELDKIFWFNSINSIERNVLERYDIYKSVLPYNAHIMILYDKKENTSRIINNSVADISLIIRYFGASLNSISSNSIETMVDIISEYYEVDDNYPGTSITFHNYIEDTEMYAPLIQPNKITLEQIKSSYFPPELTIISSPKLKWSLKYITYMADGRININVASGEITNNKNFELAKVEVKELYPKDSVKVDFAIGLRPEKAEFWEKLKRGEIKSDDYDISSSDQ